MNSNLKSKIVNQESLSGIYLHIPFCKKACHYCNFHFSTALQSKHELIEALVKEIHLTPYTSLTGTILPLKETCDTVYFGGGTPSILEKDDLTLIFDALQAKFIIAEGAEITLEANPDDISPAKLKDWKQAGINRLSVGIQSFLDSELLWMNRAHSAADAISCIKQIKDAGFTEYSVDLIYGSPLLNNRDWENNLNIVIDKSVPHISCYALTVEPKTALDKMIRLNKSMPVDAETQAEQFMLLMSRMEQAGYEHYEISNFSRPGSRSRHNSSYWQGKNYYGFGPSAHSYDGKKRKWNIANNALYIQSLRQSSIPYEEELLTETQRLNEYIMTSLRTMEGIDLEKLSSAFGLKCRDILENAGDKYIRNNKLEKIHSRLVLTNEGKLFADGIAADLFF